jgi:hypothetical protein
MEIGIGTGLVYYTGQILNGRANGTGKVTYQSGITYEGEFKDNMRHGKGKMTWPNGDVLEVKFKNDERDGLGKMTRRNGDVQYYEYKKDDLKKEHYGPQTWQNKLSLEEMMQLQKVAGLGGSKRQRRQSKRQRRQSKRR